MFYIMLFSGHYIVDRLWLINYPSVMEMPTRLDLIGDQTKPTLGTGQCHILALL